MFTSDAFTAALHKDIQTAIEQPIMTYYFHLLSKNLIVIAYLMKLSKNTVLVYFFMNRQHLSTYSNCVILQLSFTFSNKFLAGWLVSSITLFQEVANSV